jgi:hypothetical protein
MSLHIRIGSAMLSGVLLVVGLTSGAQALPRTAISTNNPVANVLVTVALAPGEQPTWTKTSHYVGAVTYADGQPITTVETLDVSMKGSWWTTARSVTTAADGTFGMDIAPACPGSSTLTVTVRAVNNHGTATTSLNLAVAKTSAVIRLEIGDGKIPNQAGGWGGTFGISVLGATGTSTYEAYVQPIRGTQTVLAQGAVAYGVPQLPVPNIYTFVRKSLVTIVFHGDEGVLPGTTTIDVTVAPGLVLAAAGSGQTSNSPGTWHFKRKGDPQWFGAVGPHSLASQVRLIIQKRVGTTWRSYRTLRPSNSGDGFAFYSFPGPHLVKVLFRARLVYTGNADFAKATSSWRQFKFR